MLGSFFQCDPDLRLADSEIYLDPQEPRRIGLISHGHSDHIGRHEHFVATPATAAFLRAREGNDLAGTELAFGAKHSLDAFDVSLHPAGHVLGSSMIRIGRGDETLLYTGDFRLRPSLTAEPAEVPPCDAVIMESTYGSPEWRFPTRAELREDLLNLIRRIFDRGRKPLLLAYSLGKAQEAMAMLRGSDFRVVVHPVVARISAIYERHGVDLGQYEVWGPQSSLFGRRTTADLRGKVMIMPPHMKSDIRRISGAETVSLTGWALHRRDSFTNHSLPLSDHADFDELIEFAGLCGAKTIYVTHGSARFARELRQRGFHAQFLKPRPQMRLF
jgi:Cft2 family RNA processing exonuclease